MLIWERLKLGSMFPVSPFHVTMYFHAHAIDEKNGCIQAAVRAEGQLCFLSENINVIWLGDRER